MDSPSIEPPPLDPVERPPADEALAIARLIHMTAEMVERDPSSRRARRGGHGKAHGTVRAELTIAGDLPPELAVGLFAEPRSYPAWIRFSSASPKPKPDRKRDIRGMAIKILEVEGPTLEPSGRGGAHDLLLVSDPTFFIRDAVEFAQIAQGFVGQPAGQLALLRFLATHPANLGKLLRRGVVASNPLALRYYSVAPSRHGELIVKYGASPSTVLAPRAPERDDDHFMRHAMQRTLAEREVVFDIGAQVRTHPERMPIEDAMTAWDEALSPFRKLASLRIPVQRFDTPERDELGESMDFTPWRCGPDHRPLGSLNRARRAVYATMAELRQRGDGVEPSTGREALQ